MNPKRHSIADRPHHGFAPSVEELERIVVPNASFPYVGGAVVTHAFPGRDGAQPHIENAKTPVDPPPLSQSTRSAVPGMSFARALDSGAIGITVPPSETVIRPDDSSSGGGGSSFGGGGTTYGPTGYGSSSFHSTGGSPTAGTGYTTFGGIPTSGGGTTTYFGGSSPGSAGYSTYGSMPSSNGATTAGAAGGSSFNVNGGFTSYGSLAGVGTDVFSANGNNGTIPGGGTLLIGGTNVNVGTSPIAPGGTTPDMGSPGYPYGGNDTSIFNNNGGFTVGTVNNPSPGTGPASPGGTDTLGVWYGSNSFIGAQPALAVRQAASPTSIAPPGALAPTFGQPPAQAAPTTLALVPINDEAPPQAASVLATIPLASAAPQTTPPLAAAEATAAQTSDAVAPATAVLVGSSPDSSGNSPASASVSGIEEDSPILPATDPSQNDLARLDNEAGPSALPQGDPAVATTAQRTPDAPSSPPETATSDTGPGARSPIAQELESSEPQAVRYGDAMAPGDLVDLVLDDFTSKPASSGLHRQEPDP